MRRPLPRAARQADSCSGSRCSPLLGLLSAGTLAAYTVHLKDGSSIVTKKKYVVQGDKAILRPALRHRDGPALRGDRLRQDRGRQPDRPRQRHRHRERQGDRPREEHRAAARKADPQGAPRSSAPPPRASAGRRRRGSRRHARQPARPSASRATTPARRRCATSRCPPRSAPSSSDAASPASKSSRGRRLASRAWSSRPRRRPRSSTPSGRAPAR